MAPRTGVQRMGNGATTGRERQSQKAWSIYITVSGTSRRVPYASIKRKKKGVVDRHCYPSQLRVPNSFPEKWQMDYKSLIQGGSVVLPSEEASRERVWFLRLFTMTEMNSCVRECVRALQPPMKLETQPPA